MSWYNALPRPYYKDYERVDLPSLWFTVYKMPYNVYAICEPNHFQEVNSFLIIGDERALLFDTGMGIANIKEVVDELYKGEVLVVNSHFHFDHIGDNSRFDKCHCFDNSRTMVRLKGGCSNGEIAHQVTDDMFLGGIVPTWFDKNNFEIKGSDVTPIAAGHVFDLGGRTLKVLHTPGHSPDSIMLHDEGNGLLFTGDTFYLGALYAQFCSDFFGSSNLAEYAKTMEKLFALVPSLNHLYCSHNEITVPPHKLCEAATAFSDIISGRADKLQEEIGLHSYEDSEESLRRYVFEGFSIITARE